MALLPPGTYQTPDNSTIALMDAARAKLQQNCLDTAAKITLTPSFDAAITSFSFGLIGDGSNNGQEAALNAVGLLKQNLIDPLCNQDWFSVMSGEKPSAWWFSRAELAFNQLREFDKDLDDWSWSGLGSAYVVDTSKKVAAKFNELEEKAEDTLKYGVPAILVVAALVAVAVILVKLK